MELHPEQPAADNGNHTGSVPSPNAAPQSVLDGQVGDWEEKFGTKPKPAQEVGEADSSDTSEEAGASIGRNVMEEGEAGMPVAALDTSAKGDATSKSGNGAVGDPSSFQANPSAKPQHEQITDSNINEGALDASPTVLDIEQGGGAAAVAMNKPPRKSVSSRKRSSVVRGDSDERRRSSQVAAERRAEAQKAAAAALEVAGGLAYANVSNHSTNSIATTGNRSDSACSGLSNKGEQGFQSSEPAKTAGAPPAASSSSDGPNRYSSSSAGQPNDATTAREDLTAPSISKRALPMESQQTAVETAPVGALATKGGGGDDGEQEEKAKTGQGSGTTAAVSDAGNGRPLHVFPTRVDRTAMLQNTCLKTNYSLRHQLYLSFGTVSAMALMFVILVAIITTSLAGNQVKYSS